MTRAQLEKRYGVAIVENGYFALHGYIKLYDIYAADGCRWDTGFRTIKEVEEECKTSSKALIDIKRRVNK